MVNVEKQQLLLAYLGYYDLRYNDGSLAVDGICGPSMDSAIRQFQKDFGLPVTGECDTHTEQALRHAIAYGMPEIEPECPPSIPDLYWPGKYFAKSEFACKCGRCGGFPADPSTDLVRILDKIREHFGRPTTITSGVRCKAHNASVGGVSNSQHLYGTAADIIVQGISPSQVADYAETLLQGTGGIGRYRTFTHVDVRKQKSRWFG